MTGWAEETRAAAERYIDALSGRTGEWLDDRRRAAASRIAQLGLPERHQEGWRYTSVEGLLEQAFTADEEAPSVLPAVRMEQLCLGGSKAGTLVFVDGIFRKELSFTGAGGFRFSSLRSVMAEGDLVPLEALGSLAGNGGHAFSALNLATMQDGAVVRIPGDTSLEEPIELLHIATDAAAGRMLRPRHLILLEKGARASIVERYLSLTDGPYFGNMVCEIILGEDASLDHQRVQQESLQAYHLSELHVQLGARARYRGVNGAVGGRWSRTEINAGFLAAGASLELEGLYLAGDGQLVDFHLDVDHGVAGCDSTTRFKGIAFGRGRAVFDGRILVRRQAQKSNAHLSNANLMLSRRSEIDTKPQLEILADDVQCSHGTTVGQLDPQAIFYLRSRGFDLEQARRLLCLGFASEILDAFEHDQLREQLTEFIRRRVESIGPETV